MQLSRLTITTLALSFAVPIVACDRAKSKPTGGEEGSSSSADPAAAAEHGQAAASHGPAIYFVLERGGMVMLRDGGFEPVAELKSLSMHDAPIKAPGSGFYTYAHSMLRFDGTLTDLGAAPDTKVSRPHQLTPDGKLVATGTTSAGVYDGKAWQTWDVAEQLTGIEISNPTVTDAGLAPDGTLVASLPTHLAVRSASGEWTAYEVPIVGNYGGRLAVGSDGVVLISLHSKQLRGPSGAFTFSNGTFEKVGSKVLVEPYVEFDGILYALEIGGRALVRLVDGKLETVYKHGGRGQLSHLTLGADAKLYAMDAENRQVLRFEQGEVTLLPGTAGSLPFSLSDIKDNFDVDAAGRVWLRSAYGVHLIDGDAVVNLLPGPEHPLPSLVERVVVSGAGPAKLPELKSAGLITRTGTVVGKDGAPAAGVPVEICALLVSQDTPFSTGTFRGKTPCATSDDVFGQVETDAEGRFTVADTPRLGTISVAYRDAKSWMQFLKSNGLQSCYETRDGETCDVGTIKLEN